jgi:hypothetical protein
MDEDNIFDILESEENRDIPRRPKIPPLSDAQENELKILLEAQQTPSKIRSSRKDLGTIAQIKRLVMILSINCKTYFLNYRFFYHRFKRKLKGKLPARKKRGPPNQLSPELTARCNIEWLQGRAISFNIKMVKEFEKFLCAELGKDKIDRRTTKKYLSKCLIFNKRLTLI